MAGSSRCAIMGSRPRRADRCPVYTPLEEIVPAYEARRGARGRVLAVDDDSGVRDVLTCALEQEGYEVRCAEHGSAALALLERWSPDLILLDLEMPILDGAAFRRGQLARPAWAAIPVVVLTASPAPVGNGLVGLPTVRKPMNLDSLLGTIGSMLTAHPS
jgi:CheY-like chemotaxis protein